LASDKISGRETGTQGYEQAEELVLQQFTPAGLSPAGTKGFKQSVPLHSLKLQPEASPVRILRPRRATKLDWFRQVTVAIRQLRKTEKWPARWSSN
jgi:hypothetical protein